MAWIDNLRAATFRGVPFKVDTHDTQGGRRTVRHDFPYRDMPFVEDMGRRGKEFSIDAYVVGDDYMRQRDEIMRACDEPGSAELVHPYLGTLQVVCTGWSLRESKSEGRMARFSLSFLEVGQPDYPSGESDFASRALLAYGDAKQSVMDSFADAFSIDGLPGFAFTDALQIATDAIEAVQGAVRFVADVKQNGIGVIVARLLPSLSGMLSAPLSLASTVFGLYSSVADLFDSDDADPSVSPERRALSALMPMFSFDGGRNIKPIQQTTSTRRRQQDNRDALINLFRQAAVVEAVRIAPAAEYETEDDAIRVRDRITDAIDEISEAPYTSDAMYAELQKLRTIVVGGVPPAAVALPNLVTLTPPATVPSLVLAYDTYEDAARDVEIVSRNAIKRPGFVPAAVPLRVISNV